MLISLFALAFCLLPSAQRFERIAFPGSVSASSAGSVEVVIDPLVVESFRTRDRLYLAAVPWSTGVVPWGTGATGVDLQLARVEAPVDPDALHVDGARRGSALSAEPTFWTGQVVGQPESDVFLAFAAGQTWGWLKLQGELVHVVSRPNASGDWTRGTTRFVSDGRLAAEGLRFAPRCATEPAPLAPPPSSSTTAGSFQTPRLLACELAVETDWQFFQLFGDLAVAEGYVRALLAAANTRFRTQVGVLLVPTYLGFYTTPNDPWTSQDTGGDCFDALFEFQAAWMNGGAPVDANLHHMLSGEDLGCGVAFLDELCDPEESFGLTSRLDGLTSFPVAASPLNWDFVWMCHELGHNFGSPHTHQYCPPLDECSPAGFWGDCQDEMACTSQAGLMSYCHACPGGMANFTTWFHPVVADTMRAASEASCFVSLFER